MSLSLLVTCSHVCPVCSQDSVSVHRPGFYASRFLKFMSTCVFRKTHRKSAGCMASHMRESRTETGNKCKEKEERILLVSKWNLVQHFCVSCIKLHIICLYCPPDHPEPVFCLLLSPIVCYLRHMIQFTHECEL